jgi:two-component system sensor histidine kinase YesM
MINDIGLLCMVLDSSIIEGLSNNSITGYDSNVFMVDNSSELLSVVDGNQTSFEYGYLLNGDSGSFRMNTDLYIYQKIGNWNYYLISKISLMNMYKNNIIVIIILSVITVAITYFGLIITRRMVKKNYQPLDNLIKKMNYVAEGKLDVRINIENVGNDYKKLSNGFNYMMEEINTLIIQVKQEQQQMNQLRFNALQSQIQPHFLYNTLDCIHWQAKAEGNEEISVLVKALAQYYRLCLSKGKDVIRIEQEMEHVKNYLIIQNIRYDNIIECEINIDDNCRASLIPKITLQPLVENSIYHGIKVKEGKKGVIKITCQKKGDEVIITVEDNGTGMTEEQINEMNQSISQYDKDFGYGIQNVNKRIEILFGREYGLHYEKNNLGGVTVVIHLPNHGIPEYEEVL